MILEKLFGRLSRRSVDVPANVTDIDLAPGRALFDGLALALRRCAGIRDRDRREAEVRRAFSQAARDYVRIVNKAAELRGRR